MTVGGLPPPPITFDPQLIPHRGAATMSGSLNRPIVIDDESSVGSESSCDSNDNTIVFRMAYTSSGLPYVVDSYECRPDGTPVAAAVLPSW